MRHLLLFSVAIAITWARDLGTLGQDPASNNHQEDVTDQDLQGFQDAKPNGKDMGSILAENATKLDNGVKIRGRRSLDDHQVNGFTFEDDMVLNKEQVEWLMAGRIDGTGDGLTDIHLQTSDNALIDPNKQWPNNIVYYDFDQTFQSHERNQVRSALARLQEEVSSCITFQEKQVGNRIIVGKSDYRSPGCWSEVGYKEFGPQYLKLTNRCLNVHGIIQHEFLHAIGIHHAQSRSDRNEYVTIMWNNIKENKTHNFEMYDETRISHHGLPYDYKSIMHYSKSGFRKIEGQITIKTKDPSAQDIIGQREGLSFGDIELVRRAYGCSVQGNWFGNVSTITIQQCEKCQCEDEVCEKVFDRICHEDGVCTEELRKCIGPCLFMKKSKNKTEVIKVEPLTPEEVLLLERIVEKEIAALPGDQKLRIKKSAATRLDFDRREMENSNIIVDCVKEKGIDMEFIPKNTSIECNEWFKIGTLDVFFAKCQAEWISGYNRAAFYEKCLKHTNIESFHWKLRQQTKLLEQIAFNVERYSKDFSDARVVGGSQLIAGGILCGLGVVIPPLAPVASFLGIGLTITGSATTMAATLLGADWTDQEATLARDEMLRLDADYHKLANLIGLYLKSHKYLTLTAELGSITALSSLEDKIFTSLIQASPAMARLPEIVKEIFKQISKSSLVKGLGATKFVPRSNIFNFVSKDLAKVSSAFSNSKFGMALNNMIKSTTYKGTRLMIAGKLVVPGLTLAIGVWDVVCGADKSNVHKGLLHEIKLARRTLEINGDSVKNAYIKMFPEYTNFTDGDLASVSLLEFHIKEGAWHYQNGIKLRMQSTNNDNITRECYTEAIFNGIQDDGTWITVFENRILGECGNNFIIFNDLVSIQLISQHVGAVLDDRVVVDEVNIGTNGHFLPSLTCKGKDLTVNAANRSEWMSCTRKQGISKIKTHTSNKKYAGTDNYIEFGFDIPTMTGKSVHCKTSDLNNFGNDHERGETDIYRPADGSFGTCRDSTLANAILERDPEKPILLTIISTNYLLWDDQWHPDSVKVYFNTKESKNIIITCALCDRKKGKCADDGWGYWVTQGNITFECFPLTPKFPERSIEKIQVKTCELSFAGSNTNTLKMKICSKPGMMNNTNILSHDDYLNGVSPCCTTNLFGNKFTYGEWSNDIDGKGVDHDGGEQLGQCEGFPIDGTQLYLGLKNEGNNAICLDGFKFYGGYDVGVSSSRDIPIIQCDTSNTCQLWSDSNQNYCEGNRDWYGWRNTEVNCQFVNNTSTVKTIAMKVCDKVSSGSKATFQVVIKNMDDEECVTDEFKSDFTPGHYFEISNMGECLTHAIKENKATVWILNLDGVDDLCLSDVYLDVSDSSGQTSMLKCRVDQDKKMQLNVSGNDRIGLPLTCI